MDAKRIAELREQITFRSDKDALLLEMSFREIEKLRAALKPFAKHSKMYPLEQVPDDSPIWYLPTYDIAGKWATIGDCRRAAEALGEE